MRDWIDLIILTVLGIGFAAGLTDAASPCHTSSNREARPGAEWRDEMASKTYTCRRFKSVGEFEYAADFTQAASGITVRFSGHDDWQPVPFQVADARHDRRRAEQMIADYFR